MGVLRGMMFGLVGLLGVVLGAVLFLLIGLFAVSPPAISQAAPGQDWDVTIEITDTFLSAQLNRSDGGGGGDQPVQLSNAKSVARADGTLTITGNVDGSPGGGAAPSSGPRLPINTSAISVPVEIVKAQFGPLPVPNQIGKLLENPVNSQIAKTMNSQPFLITNITVRDGAMVVRARQTTP